MMADDALASLAIISDPYMYLRPSPSQLAISCSKSDENDDQRAYAMGVKGFRSPLKQEIWPKWSERCWMKQKASLMLMLSKSATHSGSNQT
jgi:hypothetical protein